MENEMEYVIQESGLKTIHSLMGEIIDPKVIYQSDKMSMAENVIFSNREKARIVQKLVYDILYPSK